MPPCRCCHSFLGPPPSIAEAEAIVLMRIWHGTRNAALAGWQLSWGGLTNFISLKQRKVPPGRVKVLDADSAM